MIERADLSQYNPAFDSQRFTTLMAQRGTVGFELSIITEKAYIAQQLRTDLGERLNVAKSEFIYEIRDGLLYEPGRDEPFERVMERGYAGRRVVDASREKVEFTTWKTMQSILTNPYTPDGTIVLDFSPRGGKGTNYEDDYIDAHIKRGNQIVSARYKSDLTKAQCREKIVGLNPYYDNVLPQKPTDIDIKTAPVILPPHLGFSDPDALVKSLLGREVGIPQEDLDEVWAVVTPLATSYINTLVENPGDLYSLEQTYRALLVASHKTSEQVIDSQAIAKGKVIYEDREFIGSLVKKPAIIWGGTRIEIQMLASEEVKIGGGACGSGSCSTTDGLSTNELDNIDGRGPLNFSCPDCGKTNTRPLFQYVKNCQKCGSDKVLPKSVREKLGLNKVN